MILTAVLAFPIDEKLKKEVNSNSKKHPNQVNKTNALSMFKEKTVSLFVNKIIQSAINAFDKILEAITEIIRPNRKFVRKKLKKKPPSMNYKQL